MKVHSAPPSASSLIESMRDIGYSFETALADIIDNSIAARATSVDILCDTGGRSPVIGIVDNGCGMSETELLNAMRPGSKNPLDYRDERDLGRFGLGLKTASFSQCRKVTVVTRRAGETSAALWDLDFVADEDDWLLQMPSDNEIQQLPFVEKLEETGTLVIWEHLDRLSDETQRVSLKDHIFEQLDVARNHIALVFHRFIAGERRLQRVAIKINEREIEPFDPFHSRHPATQQQPEEKIRISDAIVRVQPFILPHHKKVSRLEWEKHAGEGGYLQNQGFYVYRSGRLIIHGTWFRLARKAELTKLARVRVDMPNELDDLWKIDVKKASAAPPLIVRHRLRSVIDKIAGASNRVYTQRGRRVAELAATPFWARRIDKNQITYELNRENPTVGGFLELLDDNQAREFETLLRLIEASFPADALYSDLASRPESVSDTAFDPELYKSVLSLTVQFLRDSGLCNQKIKSQLSNSDPYRLHWRDVEAIVDDLLGGDENVQ